MSQNVFEMLTKQAQNVEIEDIVADSNQDFERQSQMLVQFERKQSILKSSQIKDNNNNNNQNELLQSEDEIVKNDLNKILNQMEGEYETIYKPENDMRLSYNFSKQQSDQENISVNEIEQELNRLTLSEELKGLLINSIDRIENIIEMTPLLINQFDEFQNCVDLLINIQKTLFFSLIQLQEVTKILAIDDDHPEEAKEISEQYSALQYYCIYVESKKDINLPILQTTLCYLSEQVYREIEFNYQQLLSLNIKENTYMNYLNEVKIIHSKLKTTIQVFPYAATFDQKDLFSQSQDGEQWNRLNKKVQRKLLGEKEQVRESFKVIVKGILLANAMVAKGAEQNTAFEKSLYQNFGAIYYFFQSQQAQKKAHLFFSEPRTSTAIQVWNLMDQGFIKIAMKMMFPSIKYNKKIYISPVAQRITLDSVRKSYEDNNYNQIEQIQLKGNVRLEMDNEDQYYTDLFKAAEDKVVIRILSPSKLFRPDLKERDHVDVDSDEDEEIKLNDDNSVAGNIQNLFTKMKGIFSPKKQFYEKIIIHIHGGGFVAMSSRCHQTYSRQWANQLNVPIFSIDYKKAPQHPYPSALDDCWQAYNWILNFVSRFFNIKPKKVVLVGDSAGGNLVTALTLKCIKSGVRVPDGIVLAYPALNLNLRYFTPSFLLALDDQILPHTFLKMCLDSYVPEELNLKPESDPFISPIYASDELLKELPPTRILVGTNDPLHDECWRFLQKLEVLNKDVRMVVYEEMPHGFLNYDAPSGMKEAKTCVQDAANFLKELLDD